MPAGGGLAGTYQRERGGRPIGQAGEVIARLWEIDHRLSKLERDIARATSREQLEELQRTRLEWRQYREALGDLLVALRSEVEGEGQGEVDEGEP